MHEYHNLHEGPAPVHLCEYQTKNQLPVSFKFGGVVRLILILTTTSAKARKGTSAKDPKFLVFVGDQLHGR